MILSFSAEGFLPPGRYTCTVDEYRMRFVDAFPNTNRRSLYDEWHGYTKRLQDILHVTDLVQWIDGSFTTNKLKPGDIDVVTFIPRDVYTPVEDTLIDFYSTANLYERGLDAYLCPVYPVHHERYATYQTFRQDWQQLFESQRSSTSKKGFLEITLSYGR